MRQNIQKFPKKIYIILNINIIKIDMIKKVYKFRQLLKKILQQGLYKYADYSQGAGSVTEPFFSQW